MTLQGSPDINLSDLPSLLTLRVRVSHRSTRGRDTELSTLLRSAIKTTATGEVSSSGLTDIHYTIKALLPISLGGVGVGLDAVLSGVGYQQLRRLHLLIKYEQIEERRLLEMTENRDLETYYRRQLAGLAGRGVLDLKMIQVAP